MLRFKLVLIVILLAFNLPSFAQEAPVRIKEAVLAVYPTKNPLKAFEKSDKNWYFEFIYEYKLYQVIYDTKNNKIASSKIEDTLPTAVIDVLSKKYTNLLIVEFERKNNPATNTSSFEIELREQALAKKRELVIDEKGKILEEN